MTIFNTNERSRLVFEIKDTINEFRMHKRCQLRLMDKWKHTHQLRVKCDLKIVKRLIENSVRQLKELKEELKKQQQLSADRIVDLEKQEQYLNSIQGQ